MVLPFSVVANNSKLGIALSKFLYYHNGNGHENFFNVKNFTSLQLLKKD